MSVKILNREYRNAFRPEPTDWLLGNVGDWLRAKFLVEVGIDYLATSSEPITINTEEKTITLMNGKKWSDYGFDIGNTVTMQYIVETTVDDDPPASEPVELTFTITQLYNDTLVYDAAAELAELGFETIPTDRGNERVYAVKLYVDREIEGLVAKYNHTSNAQVQNNVLTSFIDGNVTEAIYVGLNNIGPEVANMNLIPNQSGMSVQNATVKKILSETSEAGAKFNVPTQEIAMSFNAVLKNKVAESIKMFKLEGTTPPFQDVNNLDVPINTTAFGQYINGTSGMMLINDADFDGLRYLDLSLAFSIISQSNVNSTKTLKIVLLKYNGGASYDFVDKTELASWNYLNADLGLQFNFGNVVPVNVVTGESYCVAFEFSATGSSLVTRHIKLNVLNGSANILEGLTETNYKRRYEVEFNFLLSSFFEDADSIPNRVPPEIVFDSGSLTDNIELKFLPEWNNPNVYIKNEPGETERLGNTGWFNENFNGLPNNYQVTDVEYMDLGGATMPALSFGTETKIRARILGVPNLQAAAAYILKIQFYGQPALGGTPLNFTVNMPGGNITINKTFNLTGSADVIVRGSTLNETIDNALANLIANDADPNVTYIRSGNNIHMIFAAPGVYANSISSTPGPIQISTQSGNPGTVFQYGWLWNPKDETQYKDKETPFHQNVKINSPANTAFSLGTNNPFNYPGFSEDGLTRMDVHDVSFMQDGNDVVFEAIFKPTPEFTAFYESRPNDRNYCIWISASDSSLISNFSDRASLIIDNRDMEYFIPISGELPNVTNVFIEHPEAETVPGVPIYNGFLEDDILCRSFFPLNIGDRLSQVIMGFEVQNVVTGASYELDRFGAALSQYVTDVNGIQQLNLQTERGFKFVESFNKNWVKALRNPTMDSIADVVNNIPARSGYTIYFGAKIRWEQWLAKQLTPAAQAEFFNASLPLNGFNQNWLGYLRAGQHKVNYFILFDVVSAGITTRYKNAFEISFDGYDENEDITTEHKYFNNATNVELSAGTDAETERPVGMLLSNEKTRIEITYTKVTGEFDLSNFYAVTTLEIDGGPGVMQHRQLSSIVGSEGDNPLIPLSGQTKLKVTQTAPNVIKTECLVDNTRLQQATRYKITGRIGCFANEGGAPIETQIYENKYINQYQ